MIRTRISKTGEVSGHDRKGKDDADVDDKRCDEQLRFVGGSQASREYRRLEAEDRTKRFPFVI